MTSKMISQEEEQAIGLAIEQAFTLKRLPGEDLRTVISRVINALISHDFNLLVTTLYRLDIPENKISDILVANPGKDAADLIADLIIERELEKFKSRQQFKRNDPIPDEDKW
jgi:hypothetical protein